MQNTRGSEWRKWDLHIHTPYTKLANQFKSVEGKDVWDTFCDKLEASDVAAFGITDYFSIDNYLLFNDKFNKRHPSSHKVFFPNIEFRLDSKNSKNNHIQVHILFSNKKETLGKVNSFLSRLKLLTSGKYCTANDLEQVGYDKAMVTIADLTEQLKFFSEYEFLIVGVASGYGSLRPNGPNDGRGSEFAKELDKRCNAFFGNFNNVDFYLNKIQGRADLGLPRKSVISGSDSHSFIELDKKLGKAYLANDEAKKEIQMLGYSWIKSNPSFEGLIQITHEPEERIKIQESKPEEKSSYQIISSINLGESDFWAGEIPLNQNLNVIIGGRSSGKSNLLAAIHSKANPSFSNKQTGYIKEHLSNVRLTWGDGKADKERDIDYFEQGYMYEVARSEEKLNKLIEDILKSNDKHSDIQAHKDFCQRNKVSIESEINKLFSIQEQLNTVIKEVKEIGDQKGIKQTIISLNSQIQNLTPGLEESEKERSIFETLQDEKRTKNHLKIAQLQDFKLLNDITEIDPFSSNVVPISQFSETTSSLLKQELESIKDNIKKQWRESVSSLKQQLHEQSEALEVRLSAIAADPIFIKGSESLLKNKSLHDLVKQRDAEDEKLTKIEIKLKIKKSLEEEKASLIQNIVNSHLEFKTKHDRLLQQTKIAAKGIEISLLEKFNSEQLLDKLRDNINLQANDRQMYVDKFPSQYISQPAKEIEDFLNMCLLGQHVLKQYKSHVDLAKSVVINNFFNFNYNLTYQNDSFKEMSDGKKSFVVLKLLLDFSKKECPILIDQPEDSLDNRAIYNELVAYLRDKKKERQIILVSHNANVVVNADAESVIVANQHGSNTPNENAVKFQYISGALENTSPPDSKITITLSKQGIKEHVCEILEGGETAFNNRKNKYAFR